MAESSKNLEEVFKKEISGQFYEIFKKVLVSEKATRLMEFENKMTFVVDRKATKPMIKLLIETEFGKKVKSVNTVNTFTDGEKRAIVTFMEEGTASQLASDLGLV